MRTYVLQQGEKWNSCTHSHVHPTRAQAHTHHTSHPGCVHSTGYSSVCYSPAPTSLCVILRRSLPPAWSVSWARCQRTFMSTCIHGSYAQFYQQFLPLCAHTRHTPTLFQVAAASVVSQLGSVPADRVGGFVASAIAIIAWLNLRCVMRHAV